MICWGVMPVGGVGSSGPKPEGSCPSDAAALSEIATAAWAIVVVADSWKREKARRLAKADARSEENGFMGEDSRGYPRGLSCFAPHATQE
jgi:hypothetical protein